jgi:glycosyltransferase involved in cell wall biosynthesis
MNKENKKFPLISVITVCLNNANFIEQTFKSVIFQTYSNIEYIVIDGGSQDGTAEIIARYKDHFAYWHSKSDRGLAHAFNLGLNQAHGDWILYLHSDDFFAEHTVVERMLPWLIQHEDADVVFGDVKLITRQQGFKIAPFSKIFGSRWEWKRFRWRDTLPHQAAFTNRKYFSRVGVFDETFKIAIDYEHYLRGGMGLKAVYVPIAISCMRRGGLSQQNLIKSFWENRRAHLKNNTLSPCMAMFNYYGQLIRAFWGVMAHKVLDPYASKIKWLRRN